MDRVWRTSLNEGCLTNLPDCALVWQVVEGRGATSEKRIAWLTRHSSHVNGLRPCVNGNCAWTRGLGRSLALPAALAGQPAYWRTVTAPRARMALAYVTKLVRGEVSDRPCPIRPWTWGGPMDAEHARLNGLIAIGCKGTLNDGFIPLSELGR